MFKFLKNRFSEVSSFAGLGLVGMGIAEITGEEKAAQVGQLVAESGQGIIADPVLGGLALVGGLFSLFKKEKGARDASPRRF